MNRPPPTPPTADPPSRPPRGARLARLVARAGRLALVAATALVGWEVMASWGLLLGGADPLARRPASAADEAHPELADLVAPGGAWEFPGWPYRVESSTLADAEVAAWFARPEAAAGPAADDPRGTGRQLAALARHLATRTRATPGGAIYLADRGPFRLLARTRGGSGGEFLVAARAALADGSGGWAALEVRADGPSADSAVGGEARAESSDLPAPAACHPLIRRRDAAGRPWLTAWAGSADLGTVADAWRAAGWRVEPLAPAGPDPRHAGSFLADRAGVPVRVWLGPGAGPEPALIVAARLPGLDRVEAPGPGGGSP